MDHFSTDGHARNDAMRRVLLVLGLLFLLVGSVWADGGTIRFQGDAGTFHVTVFTLPPILAAGVIDVTVLVQDRAKLSPLLDANVTFDLIAESAPVRGTAAWLPPACAMNPPPSLTGIPATLGHGENRLLYGTYVQIPYSGSWNLKIKIRRDTENESVATLLSVPPPAPPALAYWQLFILPPLCVLGFIANRAARRRQKSRSPGVQELQNENSAFPVGEGD